VKYFWETHSITMSNTTNCAHPWLNAYNWQRQHCTLTLALLVQSNSSSKRCWKRNYSSQCLNSLKNMPTHQNRPSQQGMSDEKNPTDNIGRDFSLSIIFQSIQSSKRMIFKCCNWIFFWEYFSVNLGYQFVSLVCLWNIGHF